MRNVTEPEKNELRSKTFLRHRVIKSMLKQGKILKAGWSPIHEKFLGYSLIAEKAFQRTDPEILLKMEPRPNEKNEESRGFGNLEK